MRKVALILHGWPQHRAGGHFLSMFLKARGYKVITPDLFGRSFSFSPEAIHGEIKEELNNQKVWRSTYIDKNLKERGYSSVDEFKDAHPVVRNQLIDAYRALEIGPEELKN